MAYMEVESVTNNGCKLEYKEIYPLKWAMMVS